MYQGHGAANQPLQHLEPEGGYQDSFQQYKNGQPPMYGGTMQAHSQIKYPKSLGNWRRRRLNVIAIFVCLFVPWLLFCFMSWLFCFKQFYRQPAVCFLVAFFILCAVLMLGRKALNALKQKHEVDPEHGSVESHEPSWYGFLFFTTLLAFVLGCWAGYHNFYQRMEPYYGINNLGSYAGVDPSVIPGEQLMDGGRVVFKPGTHLDLAKSMSFRNNDLYCVAPIVSANYSTDGAPDSYDYWAVGVNCCCGDTVRAADFQCGEYSNAQASSGLRLMRDDERPFYRLAVQQAVGAYGLRAKHPLFFYWVQDPIAAGESYFWEGHRWYLIGVYAHFLFQLLAVCFATCVFKLGG